MSLSPDAWTFLSTSVVTFGGIVVVYVQNRKQHIENRATNADLQRKVAPVSNGFAAHVTDALERIEAEQAVQRQDISEMRVHVSVIETLGNKDRRELRQSIKSLASALAAVDGIQQKEPAA